MGYQNSITWLHCSDSGQLGSHFNPPPRTVCDEVLDFFWRKITKLCHLLPLVKGSLVTGIGALRGFTLISRTH